MTAAGTDALIESALRPWLSNVLQLDSTSACRTGAEPCFEIRP
jgi:hypothetical protein